VVSHASLHAELIACLRQHCPVADERHLTLLGWMVAGMLLSQTVCFDHWKTRLLVVAIAVPAGSLQGYALSLAGFRRQVDLHWKRGMSFLRLGLAALQMPPPG